MPWPHGCKARRHMGKLIDLTGQRFGRLTVICRNGYGHHKQNAKWLCQCDCGNVKVVDSACLRNGGSKSCGCLVKQLTRERFQKHPQKNERLYRIWKGIRTRCNNPRSKNYEDYGGRGIRVCQLWDDYGAFESWALQNNYEDHLTIDRRDNNGDYSPENCRWVDRRTQGNNTRRNVYVEHDGISKTIAQWARQYDIPYETFRYRIESGIPFEKAIIR